MVLPDVNVLVHAFRSDAKDHRLCNRWLSLVVNGAARYGISPQVLSGVIRITTHPRIFAQPSELREAIHFCEVLMAQVNCILIEPGRDHWAIFSRLCDQADARGNLCARCLERCACHRIRVRVDYPR
jgi:uncharacterized protein